MEKTKVVLIGDSGVGKTAIALRLVNNTFDAALGPTIGAACLDKTYTVKNKERLYQIWDTAGEEKFRSIMPLYLQGAAGAFLVFDLTNVESKTYLKQWKTMIEAEGKIPIVLIGNKTDCEDREILPEDGQLLADEMELPYIETSALNGMGVEEAFCELIKLILGQETQDIVADHDCNAHIVDLSNTLPQNDQEKKDSLNRKCSC